MIRDILVRILLFLSVTDKIPMKNKLSQDFLLITLRFEDTLISAFKDKK